RHEALCSGFRRVTHLIAATWGSFMELEKVGTIPSCSEQILDNPRDSNFEPALPMSRRDFVHAANALFLSTSAAGSIAAMLGAQADAAPAESPRAGPRRVRSIENVWIPMSDGVKIAARLWLPEDAEQNPVPAIMDYIPYRKRDGTRLYDETRMPYLASFGYACIRPDIRGS